MSFTDDDVAAARAAYDHDQKCPHADESWLIVECDACMVTRILAAVAPAIAARALREAAPRWWIATDALARGGEKILGPFHTQEIALEVRGFVEEANRPSTYWVDEDQARAEGVGS